MNEMMFNAVKDATCATVVDAKGGAGERAAALVTRLEELWRREHEESPESAALFAQLCDTVGEQAAFDAVAHFAN